MVFALEKGLFYILYTIQVINNWPIRYERFISDMYPIPIIHGKEAHFYDVIWIQFIHVIHGKWRTTMIQYDHNPSNKVIDK